VGSWGWLIWPVALPLAGAAGVASPSMFSVSLSVSAG
jgi:hypothetical protein